MGILDSLPVATQKQLTDQTGSPGLDPSMRASVATDVKVEVLDGVLSITVGDYRSLGKKGVIFRSPLLSAVGKFSRQLAEKEKSSRKLDGSPPCSDDEKPQDGVMLIPW